MEETFVSQKKKKKCCDRKLTTKTDSCDSHYACKWIRIAFLLSLFIDFLLSIHQGEAGEGEEGKVQAAGPDQVRGTRWRGRHGERAKDLPAANV